MSFGSMSFGVTAIAALVPLQEVYAMQAHRGSGHLHRIVYTPLDCASLPIGQQIHRPAGRQVNQDRAVTLPFAEGEVIDAQCLRGSPQPGRVPGLLEAVKQSVRAQEQAEGAGNAGGGLSTNQPVQLLQGIGQARRLASIAPSNTGNRLGEDTPGAIWVVAEELAAGQFNPHGIFRPGQVWSVRG